MAIAALETITPARLDWRADMPAGLTPGERDAYTRGYTRAAQLYTKKNGAPSVVTDGPAPAAGTAARRMLGHQLAALTRAHELERHPSAHRGAMSALRKYRKVHGIAEPAAPRKARARKTAAPVADALAAGIDSGRVVIVPVSDPAPVETPAPVDVAPATTAPVRDYAPRSHESVTIGGPGARNTRRAARRELAEAMRARGEDPRNLAAWHAAKTAAGVK